MPTKLALLKSFTVLLAAAVPPMLIEDAPTSAAAVVVIVGAKGAGAGGGGGNGGGGEAGTKKFVIPAVPFDELESSKLLLSELPFRLALPLELALELVVECCSGSLRFSPATPASGWPVKLMGRAPEGKISLGLVADPF